MTVYFDSLSLGRLGRQVHLFDLAFRTALSLGTSELLRFDSEVLSRDDIEQAQAILGDRRPPHDWPTVKGPARPGSVGLTVLMSADVLISAASDLSAIANQAWGAVGDFAQSDAGETVGWLASVLPALGVATGRTVRWVRRRRPVEDDEAPAPEYESESHGDQSVQRDSEEPDSDGSIATPQESVDLSTPVLVEIDVDVTFVLDLTRSVFPAPASDVSKVKLFHADRYGRVIDEIEFGDD